MLPITPDTLEQPPVTLEPPRHRFRLLFLVLSGTSLLAIGLAIFVIRDYLKLSRVVDEQLAKGPYARTINFYAAPETVSTGDTLSVPELSATLATSGYKASRSDEDRWFESNGDEVIIHPSGSSRPNAIDIHIQKNQIQSITDRAANKDLTDYTLEPALVSNISKGRERRVIIRYADLPPVLVNAITSAEDKHFFTHGGYDVLRIAKAGYVDARDRRKEQGASTISMQLARNLYLNPEKRWQRKLTEFLITLHLEHALTKQQIFEYYCNQVYLGGYGTFSINGFGEAAHAYFSKDVNRLDLAEAATLAGLIQRPSYFNPFRFPERARDRRNVVLRMMHANKYISDAEWEHATESPIRIEPGKSEVSETQVSMDLANSEFQKLFEGEESSGITNVYTTIDMRLQKAAERAVASGMENVDRLLAKHRNASGKPEKAQAALIALDPHTGQIKAIVGGRDYSVSQLNRILAKRPPGSIFKPFVYAAALNTAVNSAPVVLTPASTVEDVPTTFTFDGQTYKPDNFRHEFHGTVTLRQALAKSMNVAAVKVGEMVGFDSVVALARQAGVNEDIRPTPSVALGAYQVTPFEMARAYTAFANDGSLVEPTAITTIADQTGQIMIKTSTATQRVLDSRVNFLLVDMLADVLKYGTAAGVRARGFTLPAAGKTGTSHDGWFAGFTSQLLCIVWVGFDDYSELGLEGAHSALPIWTQFMMEAAHTRPYRDARVFVQPDGIVRMAVDTTTGKRATPFCPNVESGFFIEGTQPEELCMIHQDNAVPTLPEQTGPGGLNLSNLPPVPAPPLPGSQ